MAPTSVKIPASSEYLLEKQKRWDSVNCERVKWLAEQRKIRLETRDKSIPDIKDFYAGRRVLITGGTGFVGKVMIEKLLRSIPHIDKIYAIVRPKMNQTPAQRIEALFKADLFDVLRKQQPDVFQKVVAIAGDVSCKGFGLSSEDKQLLQREVSVVFHAAATVRFDDPLKSAVLLNTRGTLEILELSKGMPNLKSFLYMSTTYCNTDQPVTLEKVYPTPIDWRHIIKLAETTSNSDLQPVVPMITGFQPNTYTFTKQLAEKIVDDARFEVPVVIVRPAVIVSAALEPVIGWSDNLYGPVGFCMGIMKGLLRGFYIDSNVNLNTVPVDCVSKVSIAAAWLRATDQKLSEDPSETDVINLSGEDVCNATYADMFAAIPVSMQTIKPTSLRAPRIYNTKNFLYYLYKLYTSHILFAVCVDAILRLCGQPPRLLKVTRVIHNVNMALRYFLFQNFPNITEKMWRCMAYTTDPDFFHPIPVNFMDEVRYKCSYIYKHVLKDGEAGPYRQTIIEVIHFIQQTAKFALFLWLGWKLIFCVVLERCNSLLPEYLTLTSGLRLEQM